MGYKDPAKQREYMRKWMADRRAAFFAGKRCIACGSNENLELHHVDPATKHPTLKAGTGLWSWSQKRREEEIAKCIVLCDNCHKRQHGAFKHGTINSYKRGCRCELCKGAKHAEYLREKASGRR